MPADFSPLRQAPLPDSFDRTAGWLRSAPPPRPSPAKPLAMVAALVLAVGACAWPVESEAVVGYVVEATAADAAATTALVQALDDAVPADGRVAVEVEGAAVRYVVFDAEAAEQASGAAVAEGAAVRVTPLGADVQQPFVFAAARWAGVQASPRVSDAELQAALDRTFATLDGLTPRVGRRADGAREVEIVPGLRFPLPPGSRIARSGDALAVTVGPGNSLGHADALDSLFADLDVVLADTAGLPAGAVADSVRARLRRLGADRADLDALLGTLPEGATVGVSRVLRIPDSTDTPTP